MLGSVMESCVNDNFTPRDFQVTIFCCIEYEVNPNYYMFIYVLLKNPIVYG